MSRDSQQPIARTIGRKPAPLFRPLTTDERQRLSQDKPRTTFAPKGVIIYRSHEEMDADRERWLMTAMRERIKR